MMELYPLQFYPIYKEKLWGGHKIRTFLQKKFGKIQNCGESWELSGVEGNVSIISNGVFADYSLSQLIKKYKGSLVGHAIYRQYGSEFPLLFKYIDAAMDLSVQVHPNDDLSKERHQCLGKTEMWYVLDASKEATIIHGFKRKVSKLEYHQLLNHNQLEDVLNKIKVQPGEVYFLPAGSVHQIGSGVLLAEIQQSSDITYRIYDFDRIDQDGKKRQLHQNESIEAIDFNQRPGKAISHQNQLNTTNGVLSCAYFTTNKIIAERPITLNHANLDCFKVYMGIGGKGRVGDTPIALGSVVLVPAEWKQVQVIPQGRLELLETYINDVF